MSGTEIIAPELEDRPSNLSNMYFCEVGMDASPGPQVRGGKISIKFTISPCLKRSKFPVTGPSICTI